MNLVALAGNTQGHLEILNLDSRIVEARSLHRLHPVQRTGRPHDHSVPDDLVETELLHLGAVLGFYLDAITVHVGNQRPNAADFWMLIEIAGSGADRMRQHDVIQVRRRNINAVGVGQAIVQCGTDPLVGLSVELKIVGLLQGAQHGEAIVGRAIVDNDHFEVAIVLGEDAL
ncbi:hypothetical protein D3C77_478240 [compost metagenome]